MMSIKQRYGYPLGMVAYLCLIRQRGEGNILDGIEIFAALGAMAGTPQFLAYLTQFLPNAERAGAHVFDQQRYAMAAKECLQLCLCSYRHFSRGGAMVSSHHERALRRNKPTAWIARMGVHSRIRKGSHRLQVLLGLTAWRYINQGSLFPGNSPHHECRRSLSYQWALNLLPFFLENSVAISMELAEVLRRGAFTTMAQQFAAISVGEEVGQEGNKEVPFMG